MNAYPVDGLSNGGLVDGLAVHLVARGVQEHLGVADGVELGVGLVAGVAEVLDLGHGELSHAEKSRSRADFIPEKYNKSKN